MSTPSTPSPRLHLRSHGLPLTPELAQHARRRLRFAFARFAGRLERVNVLLADVNAQRGGVDKLCAIALHARGAGSIRVERRASEIGAAIDLAAERAKHALARSFERMVDWRRHRGRR